MVITLHDIEKNLNDIQSQNNKSKGYAQKSTGGKAFRKKSFSKSYVDMKLLMITSVIF